MFTRCTRWLIRLTMWSLLAPVAGASCSDTPRESYSNPPLATGDVQQPDAAGPGDLRCVEPGIFDGGPNDGVDGMDAAGTIDAATDSGVENDAGAPRPDLFPGKWHHLPGAPAFCDLDLSAEPEKLASKWLPCPSGREGCRKLDTSWTDKKGDWLVDVSQGTDPTRLVRGQAYFKMRRFGYSSAWISGPSAYIYLIEPLDGPPVAAIGARPKWINGIPKTCSLDMAFGDYGIGYYGNLRDRRLDYPELGEGPLNGTDRIVFGWAAWSDPKTFTTKAPCVTDFGLSSQIGYLIEPTLGEKSFWFSTRAPRSTGILEIAPQAMRLLKDNVRSEHPTPAPGGAFVFDTTNVPFTIIFAKDDGSWARVVNPTPPQVVTSKTLDRSSDNMLVWVESDYDLDYANATLWTAPFATSEATLVRRKVAKLDDQMLRGGARGIANRGVFLSLIGRNEALITRLSDGKGWKIRGEPGERFNNPVWVNDDEAILEIARDPNPDSQESTNGVIRLSRAVLGEPTVPSGL